MSNTDKAAAQDYASMKLPELRKLAAERGLRGISGLRKGDLITALSTGQVPAKAEKAEKPQRRTRKPAEEKPAKAEDNAKDSGEDKAQEKAQEKGEKNESQFYAN